MSLFKVGDEVRVKSHFVTKSYPVGHRFIIGGINIVKQSAVNIYFPHPELSPGNIGMYENDLELVTKSKTFKVGDRVRIIQRLPGNTTGTCDWQKPNGDVGRIGIINTENGTSNPYEVHDGDSYLGWFTEQELELVTNKEKTTNIMTSVIEFAKNLTLSKEEKLLRKYGLKTANGEYTSEAFDLIRNKLTSENEEYLVEIATQFEKEESKKK